MKFSSWAALLAGLSALSAVSIVSCSKTGDETVLSQTAPADHGTLQLSLNASDEVTGQATAVLEGGPNFTPQTHDIDLSDGAGVVSVFFGDLPEGTDYSVRLVAGNCSGVGTFSIQPGATTVVSVKLTCPGDVGADAGTGTGSAQVTGIFPGADAGVAPCDPIANLTVSRTLQDGSAPATVSLSLKDGVVPSGIRWTSASRDGASGLFLDQKGDVDTRVSFDCTADGTAYIVAHVTVPSGDGSCTEEGQVTVACVNQAAPPPTCGDGVINQAVEQCDGSDLPLGSPEGATCSANCTLVVPVPAFCGDGVINQPSEQCDGSALSADAGPGSTCNSDCTLALPNDIGPCGQCAAGACADQRAAVDASAAAGAIVACVLGTDWQAGQRAADTSCANGDLLSCYCGDVSAQNCATADPATLAGLCTAQILAGTDCTSSSCVAVKFVDPANANGIAMSYLSCQQDNCYDVCFAQ